MVYELGLLGRGGYRTGQVGLVSGGVQYGLLSGLSFGFWVILSWVRVRSCWVGLSSSQFDIGSLSGFESGLCSFDFLK